MVKYAYAAVLEKIGCPLSLKNIEIPKLLDGQVLIKILYSGVCRSQLMEVKGGRGNDPWIPHLLGHEGSGIVIGIGNGVTKVNLNDEVILGWIKGSGLEAPGAVYQCDNKKINSGRVTTFSNYSIVSENRLVKKPSSLSFDTAVLFGCALPTGAGMVFNEIKPKQNHSAIVLGLGGIGLSALLALKSKKLKSIIALDISNEKLRLAKQLGATHALNVGDADFSKKIQYLINDGVDFCIESAGTVSSIELGFSLIKKHGGKLLFASHPPEGDFIKLAPYDLISGKKIAGSWGGGTNPDFDIPVIYSAFARSRSNLEALITKKYSLDQINQALLDLENGEVFRPLIVMEHPN